MRLSRLFLMIALPLMLLLPMAAHAQVANRYESLPQDVNEFGFPVVGFPSAPLNVVVFGSFDDEASGRFFRESFDVLYNRALTGEVGVVYVPLHSRGSIPGGRGAARAAVCAGEQNAFWPFFDLIYSGQETDGTESLSGERLLEYVTALSAAGLLDRARWDECMLSERPDQLLDDAANAAAELTTFTGTPFVTVNGDPSLTDPASLESIIQLGVERAQQQFEELLESTPEVTPEVIEISPLQGDRIEPPVTLALPQGWAWGYDTLLLQDIDGVRTIPFAIYQGPVTGGMGTIVLLWGFPNLVSVENPLLVGTVEPNLWSDGLRLLRLAVIEDGCNIGTDLRRDYSIGGLTAVGTQFSAVDCPALTDTRGWFAGLQQNNLNFIFYAYTEPLDAMSGAAVDELQAILDSITFQPLASVAPEATPEATASP
jgi:protein-disulfide isomerase